MAPVAHIAGMPVEETLPALAPALTAWAVILLARWSEWGQRHDARRRRHAPAPAHHERQPVGGTGPVPGPRAIGDAHPER